MADPIVTYVGNVAGDPELRFTQGGKAVANFTLAIGHRVKKGDSWEDGGTTWVRVNAWEGLAENVVESVHKGDRVIVQGRQVTREYEDREGNKRSSLDLQADAIGPDLRFATATVTKVGNRPSGGGSTSGTPAAQSVASDPWTTSVGGQAFEDSPPF